MIPAIAARVTIAWSVCLSAMLSVTLIHPAKDTGWNEMPFGRDTSVVPSNIGPVFYCNRLVLPC